MARHKGERWTKLTVIGPLDGFTASSAMFHKDRAGSEADVDVASQAGVEGTLGMEGHDGDAGAGEASVEESYRPGLVEIGPGRWKALRACSDEELDKVAALGYERSFHWPSLTEQIEVRRSW